MLLVAAFAPVDEFAFLSNACRLLSTSIHSIKIVIVRFGAISLPLAATDGKLISLFADNGSGKEPLKWVIT